MAMITTQNTEESLDLVQDAMFKLVQRYRTRDASEWGPLFHRILQHRVRDWKRRKWVRDRWQAWFPQKDKDENNGEDPIQNIPDTKVKDMVDQIAEKDATSELASALRKLPLRQREAFLLRAWEGYNVSETALAMGCSGGSVKTHYSRALKALRKCLEKHGPIVK